MKQSWKELNVGIKAIIIATTIVIALMTIALVVGAIKQSKLEKQLSEINEQKRKELENQRAYYVGVVKGKDVEISDLQDTLIESRKLGVQYRSKINFWKKQAENRQKEIDEITEHIASLDSAGLRDEYMRLFATYHID